MEDALPDGWTVWDHEPTDRLILAFRPDVFDGEAFPPACLPTIYVREGERDRRPGPAMAAGTEGSWSVTLFLEPDVADRLGTFADWDTAVDAATELAHDFVAGEVDVGALYHEPRSAYLDRLESIIG